MTAKVDLPALVEFGDIARSVVPILERLRDAFDDRKHCLQLSDRRDHLAYGLGQPNQSGSKVRGDRRQSRFCGYACRPPLCVGGESPRIDRFEVESPVASDFKGRDFRSPYQTIDRGLIDL